jgi:hypothetical protein
MRRSLLLLAVLLLSRVAEGDGFPPLPPGTIVRIGAPKTFRIPGAFTVGDGRITWHGRKVEGDPSRLAAVVEGQPQPIAAPQPGRTLLGTIVSAESAALVVTLDQGNETVTIPSEAIERLDVSEGRESNRKNMLMGATVGFGIGLAANLAIRSSECKGSGLQGALDCGAGIIVGNLITAGLTTFGAVAGARQTPDQKWREVWRDRLQLRVGLAAERSPGLQIALRF